MGVGVAELAVDVEVGESRAQRFPQEDTVAIGTDGDDEGLGRKEAGEENAELLDDVDDSEQNVVLLDHVAKPMVVGKGVNDAENILVLGIGDGAKQVHVKQK